MDFKVGDKVKIRPDVAGRFYGITFTVDKILPKNVDLSSPHAPRGLRTKPHFLVPADAPDADVQVPTWEPPLVVGTLVRFKNELYVVLAQNRNERYRIVKLGGDGGKYYTNVIRSHMDVVDPATLNLHATA